MVQKTHTRGILRLGDILIERGIISEDQLSESLQYQGETGAVLGQALVDLGCVTAEEIADALSWQGYYGGSALTKIIADPSATAMLSDRFCRVRRVLPIDFHEDGSLVLAMVDPGDVVTMDDVQLITGLKVSPVVTTLSALREAWKVIYPGRDRQKGASAPREKEQRGPSDRELAEYDTVISLVEEILTTGVRQRASDLHFEPHVDRMVVRVRVDGVIHHLTDISGEIKDGVVSRIKILGDMDIAEKRLPQDGRATFRADGRTVDLRIASIPAVFGESVSVRLLDDRMFNITLEGLGMAGPELSLFRRALRRPWGEILITGPTGSGKSTTLYAGLEELNSPAVKIYTAEDPVERRMPGITQTQMRPNIGLTFASALRSLLRGDPDIIMIGEVRDYETALIAAEASLTGHLLLSTLHTNDAVTAITRLMEMGVPAYLIASSLECVVAQRLARRLCPRCKETVTLTSANMTKEEQEFLGMSEAVVARAVGCSHCLRTGYSGRIGMFEILPVGGEIRDLILNHSPANELAAKALALGMKSLREDGRLKVLDGLTTIEEVERVTV